MQSTNGVVRTAFNFPPRPSHVSLTFYALCHTGGGLLVSIYDGSLQRALAEVYPNHRWNEHQFIKTAKRANADQEHRRRAKKPITNVSV
jgi:hypothetical protein